MSLQISNQLCAMQASRSRVAQRIDLKLEPFQSQSPPEIRSHGHVLHIDVRPGKTKRLDTHLMKLTIAALLRTLVAKHWPHVEQPLSAVIKQVVLDHSAYAGSSALGAQRKTLTIELIHKGVHFLLDDVSDFADGAHEKLGFFQDRHANIAITILRKPRTHRVFEKLPKRCLIRQGVVHPADSSNCLRHVKLGV